MSHLPPQFHDRSFRFLLIPNKQKKPIGSWKHPDTHLQFDDPRLIAHLRSGGNVGVIGGYGDLVVVDCDRPEIENEIKRKLPPTFTERSAKGLHFFFIVPGFGEFAALSVGEQHYGEIRGDIGHQTVVTPSTHETGISYRVVDDRPIARISRDELLGATAPFRVEQKVRWEKQTGEFETRLYPIDRVLDMTRLVPIGNGEYRGAHPFHGSATGQNFCVNLDKNQWHCFRHNAGGTALHLIAMKDNIISCGDQLKGESFIAAAQRAEQDYGFSVLTNRLASLSSLLKKNIDFIEVAREIIAKQPLYFDSAGIWWIWDGVKWVMIDEVDVLNAVHDASEWSGLIQNNIKAQLLTALKMTARQQCPEEPPLHWVLTRSGIVDINTGETRESSPKYFFKNFIPWTVGTSTECPIIDTLVSSWVQDSRQLYELMAYALFRSYPIQRVFCLLGSGSNGKGSFVRLLTRLIGDDNATSFSLKRLVSDKFQTAKLYGKLVAVATEIDYGIFENTSMIKALVGGDKIPVEFKNKTPFDTYNYAKIVISANSLPATTDRTPGFYRRWIIIDFSNRFRDGRDIIDQVPEHEFNNLLARLLGVLRDLLAAGTFTDEGDWEEKQRRYEIKSNPVDLFINDYCEHDPDAFLPMYEFREKFSGFAVQNGYRKLSDREMWGLLGLLGFESDRQRITFSDGTATQVRGIRGLRLLNKPKSVTHVTDATPNLLSSFIYSSEVKGVSQVSQVSQRGFEGQKKQNSCDTCDSKDSDLGPHTEDTPDRSWNELSEGEKRRVTLLYVLDELSKRNGGSVLVSDLLNQFNEEDRDDAERLLDQLKEETVVFEPRPGVVRKV